MSLNSDRKKTICFQWLSIWNVTFRVYLTKNMKILSCIFNFISTTFTTHMNQYQRKVSFVSLKSDRKFKSPEKKWLIYCTKINLFHLICHICIKLVHTAQASQTSSKAMNLNVNASSVTRKKKINNPSHSCSAYKTSIMSELVHHFRFVNTVFTMKTKAFHFQRISYGEFIENPL